MGAPTPAVGHLVAALSAPASGRQDAQATRRTAEEFEAVFLSQMIAHMFSGLGSSGLFGGGAEEETYRGMLYQEFGSALAKAGGIGIADAVMREMLKHQELQTS